MHDWRDQFQDPTIIAYFVSIEIISVEAASTSTIKLWLNYRYKSENGWMTGDVKMPECFANNNIKSYMKLRVNE